MRYANGTLVKLHGARRGHEDLGAIFVGQEGTIEIKRGCFRADPVELLEGAPDPTPGGRGESTAHIQNFFDCMRSRETPNADAETGHRSTTLCHLVNICRELGRKLKWDPKAERFLDDDEANQFLSRPRRKGYQLSGESSDSTVQRPDQSAPCKDQQVDNQRRLGSALRGSRLRRIIPANVQRIKRLRLVRPGGPAQR
jgi:hypothetical protein